MGKQQVKWIQVTNGTVKVSAMDKPDFPKHFTEFKKKLPHHVNDLELRVKDFNASFVTVENDADIKAAYLSDGLFVAPSGMFMEVKDEPVDGGSFGEFKPVLKTYAYISFLSKSGMSQEEVDEINNSMWEIQPEDNPKNEVPDLRAIFERETKSASWINSDIYPDGRIYTKAYTEWLEKRLIESK